MNNPFFIKCLKDSEETNHAPGKAARVNSYWKPDVCPVTGRQFFMWIEHETLGYVPTYGGPFDSYTIPTRDSSGEFSCERYDHDVGGWVEGETIGLYLIDDDEQCRVCELEERIAELEKGHQEAAKQINSWRRLAKQNIAERGKDISELEAALQRIAEQSAIVAAAEKLVRCKGRYHSELNYRALAKLFGVVTPDLPPLEHENVHYADAAEVEITALRQRIQELEAKLETADKLQDSAFRDGLKAGFSYGQTDDQSGFAQCMSAYSTRAGIGVKQQEDSVDSDVGRNQPGMVVAVHIDAGDFVKVKGQVFEVEETDFDDHDVTLWFVGGNALKCAAGCPVEVVSAPVAAGIKVKGE